MEENNGQLDALEGFATEAVKRLATLRAGLYQLRQDTGDTASLTTIMHSLTSIKEGATLVGSFRLSDLCRHLEILLDKMLSGQTSVTGRVIEIISDGADTAALLIEQLGGEAEAEPAGVEVDLRRMGEILVDEDLATPEQVDEAIKAQDLGRRPLGEILAGMGKVPDEVLQEALEIQAMGRRPLGRILADTAGVSEAAVEDVLARQKRPRAGAAPDVVGLDYTKLDQLINLIGELIINRYRYALIQKELTDRSDTVDLAAQMGETNSALARISDELQDSIMKFRMVPIEDLWAEFPGLIRTMSGQFSKQVKLVIEGEDTELDRTVIERIGEPLVGLIKNAVEFGLEPAEERQAADKPLEGTITLRARHRGYTVVIEVEDDGRGIDPDDVRRVALEMELISPDEAESIDDRSALELLFSPGFSTSGDPARGGGLELARAGVREVKGNLSVESSPGEGTRFVMTLPLSMAIIDALTVVVDEQLYAIPLDAVLETIKVPIEQVSSVDQRPAIYLRGEVLSIAELSELISADSRRKDREKMSIVIIGEGNRRLGLVVDEMLERQDVMIKNLGSFLGDVLGVSGATITGEGHVILILDPGGLMDLARDAASVVQGESADQDLVAAGEPAETRPTDSAPA